MVIVVIRKLKRRFVFVNMSILTCLMLGIQIAVFTMMYRSEVRVSEQIMDHVAQSHMDKGRGEKPPEPRGDSPHPCLQEAYSWSIIGRNRRLLL